METTLYNYYGGFYLSTGRPDFYTKGCVIFCIATFNLENAFESITREFYRTSISHCSRSVHSESIVLDEVEKTENINNCRVIRLELYSSFSPCGQCCMKIRRFLYYRPQCTLHIAFTCLYRRNEEKHSSGLRALNKHHNVRLLDIFTDKEWRLLEDRGFFLLSPHGRNVMREWDAYWRQKLIEIVTT